jgi:hypothetical protein
MEECMSLSVTISRRSLAVLASSLALVAGVAVAGQASATGTGCTPTSDGHDAAFVALDGQTISGTTNGRQCWWAVYVGPGITATVDDAQITNYYKAGVFVDGNQGSQASATVINSQVDGNGANPNVAQNGIEFRGTSASGVVRNNMVDGHAYTGANWSATGILLFDVVPSQVKTSNNKFSNNQNNLAVISSSSCAQRQGGVYASLCE